MWGQFRGGLPTNKFVYDFNKKLSYSDAGAYYCAVVACEEVIIGNGTEVDFAVRFSMFLSLKKYVIAMQELLKTDT